MQQDERPRGSRAAILSRRFITTWARNSGAGADPGGSVLPGGCGQRLRDVDAHRHHRQAQAQADADRIHERIAELVEGVADVDEHRDGEVLPGRSRISSTEPVSRCLPPTFSRRGCRPRRASGRRSRRGPARRATARCSRSRARCGRRRRRSAATAPGRWYCETAVAPTSPRSSTCHFGAEVEHALGLHASCRKSESEPNTSCEPRSSANKRATNSASPR